MKIEKKPIVELQKIDRMPSDIEYVVAEVKMKLFRSNVRKSQQSSRRKAKKVIQQCLLVERNQ